MDLQDPKHREHRSMLRAYLLGRLENERDAEALDERLLTDDEFFEELSFQEDELVEDYLDDLLTDDERDAFERHFLVSDERREKLKFAKAFERKLGSGDVTAVETEPRTGFWSALAAYLTPVPLVTAAVILVISGVIVWTVYRRPAADEALIALNRAYATERTVESRITEIGHAPFYDVRNNREPQIDANERMRAELEARRRVSSSGRAEDHHALGRVLLLKREFDEAIGELETAERMNPGDARVQNDLGAAYLERARAAGPDSDPRHLRRALDKFDRAIALDPSLLDAYFNRAECLELLGLTNEARAAWEKYIELDPSSEWSSEARQRLNALGAALTEEQTPADVERAFLEAVRTRSDAEAFDLASRNRELIREAYLPQRLAIALAESNAADRSEKLGALEYLGRIERQRIDDSFASDLARYYQDSSDERLELLRDAHQAMREGYSHCLDEAWDAAREKFSTARGLYLKAGSVIEADTIAKYFIAYTLYYRDRAASTALLDEIADLTKQRGYRWFSLMNHYWRLGGRESLGQSSFTQTKLDYEVALREAENIGDAYMTQKFLQALLIKADFVKAGDDAARYSHALLVFSNRRGLSGRQKVRNINRIIHASSGAYDAAFSKALVLESVRFATAMPDPSALMAAEHNAGIVHTRTRDWDAAAEWLERARKTGESLPEGATGREDLPRVHLNRGHLEKARGDLSAALVYYDRAIKAASELGKTTLTAYEAQKSRLLALQALGKDENIDDQIASTLELTESYRHMLLDERERNTFFESEQEVYDAAIENELRRGRDARAYDLAELSSSRSLLDWLAQKASITPENQRVIFDQTQVSAPLSLAELQAELPDDVQLIQYRVLQDRLVIWVISRTSFVTRSSMISAGDLTEKVDAYLKLVQTKDPNSQSEARARSAELYDLLVTPVAGDLDAAKDIAIVPNRILFYLPFSSLYSTGDGKFLVEKFPVLYAPSGNVFVQCTRNALDKSSERAESILSIGNPAFDRETFRRLQDLPASSSEARAVAAVYASSKNLDGSGATSRAFQAVYKDFDIIHFAGHYLTEPNSPLSSKLIMARSSDGSSVVTNSDLMKQRLPKTRLVVLSACQTGVEGYHGGEGFAGLSRTFLAAGVPVVVASSWPVDSESTSRLMKRFHGYRRQTGSTVRALRQAQIDMLHESGSEDSQPYAWAGFSVFGGYASF